MKYQNNRLKIMRLLFISGCWGRFNPMGEKYLAANAINNGHDGRLFDLAYSSNDHDHEELILR